MKKYLFALAALALLLASIPEILYAQSNTIAVDLGLSVKWASCNIGASSPEEYGDYYAWGETVTKDRYDWSTYKLGPSSSGPFSKYCTNKSYGTVDNKTVLGPEDDVAHVKLGGNWRMPTEAEQDELMIRCTWKWTQINGVNGYKVIGPNGNSIFLPAAGGRYSTGTSNVGVRGNYWSSSLYSGHSAIACGISFYPSGVPSIKEIRCDGYSIRAVLVGQERAEELAKKEAEERARKEAEAKALEATGYTCGYGWVDLGLSVKWATCNLGASAPEDYGNYYAWGETETKNITYEWRSYKWRDQHSKTLTKYNYYSSFGTVDNKTVLDLEDDVAHVKLGGNWRMPTKAEQEELMNNCIWKWTQINGVNGYKVIGPNGNSIFLPAAGGRGWTVRTGEGSSGNYWSSCLNTDNPDGAFNLYFNSAYVYSRDSGRCIGFPVRPVIE